MNQPVRHSNRRQRKEELCLILDRRDWDALRGWTRGARNPLGTLSAALFSDKPLRCWRAIEAIGLASAVVGQTNVETVRNLIRHNFWMMNDESGNVGWYAPETIGEVLYNNPDLIDEYAMRLPAFFAEEPFERGAFWAADRVASVRPDVFAGSVEELVRFSASNDPFIRYHALKALASISLVQAGRLAARMADDTGTITEYDFASGEFCEIEIRGVARSLVEG